MTRNSLPTPLLIEDRVCIENSIDFAEVGEKLHSTNGDLEQRVVRQSARSPDLFDT